MQGVAEWLASIGLDEYVQRFVENAIDLSVVGDLTEQDLKELGMPLGHRRRILRAATLLAEDSLIESQIAPIQGHAERRQLTILFCDLVGSTALSARFDPEDFRRVILIYNARVSEVIREYRGKIVQYMGDGVLAYFGYPHADDDDAKHALLAGLSLIDAVANLQVGIGTNLQVRIGIATGLVVVGDLIGVGPARAPVAIGEAPNLAARLQALAEPGEALVDTISHQLTAGEFDFRDLGARPVAGWAEPVRVWQVLRKIDVESRFEAKHRAQVPPLFGREEEMELLLRRWRQALRKEGRVVVLTGEPGVGKSHIVRAVEEQLQSYPHIRMRYFCSAYHTNSALFPIIGQLEHAARLGRSDSSAEKLSKLETLLAQSTTEPEHVAVLSELLTLPARDHRRLHELSPPALKEKMFAALLSQLDGLAARLPLYVIFEDIHWIDPTSMELLTSLIERALELPVFLVITVRPGFTPPWPNYPHITTIQIMPLDRRDGATLVEHMVGTETLPKHMMDEILARADGVPLFIEELTKTVLEAGASPRDEESDEFDDGRLHTIPTTLHGALLARLDRLGPGREVAQIGAAIGREFSYELLRAVATMPEPALRTALDRLVASGLVYRRRASTPTTYVFKHTLVRDAAEEMLLRARRKDLHDTIARALEAGFTEVVKAQPELIAHHYREAGNVVKQVRYLSIAGDQALSRSSLKEARAHIVQALQLISRLPEDDGQRRDELKLRLALARALLEQRGYADRQVAEAYLKARDLSKRVDDAGMRLAALYGLWAHHYVSGNPAAMLEQADEFLAFADREKELGSIMVGHRLVGTSYLIKGHIAEASEALREAFIRYPHDQHDAMDGTDKSLRAHFGQDIFLSVHSYRSWALWLFGEPAEAEKAAKNMLERCLALEHDDQSRLYALWHAGMVFVLLRADEKVAETAGRLMELANKRELPYWQALGSFLLGWYATRAGRPAEAVGLLQEGLTLWAQTGSRIFRPTCLAFLADAHAAAGEPNLARRTFEEALGIATETGERWAVPEIHRMFGDLLACQESPAAAIASYERAIAIAQEQGSRSFELRATTSLAGILCNQSRTAEAHDLVWNIYRTFDAACVTVDLTDAKVLLQATNP